MGSALGVEKVAAARAGVSLEEYRRRRVAGEKFCWKCRAWKPFAAFGVDRARSDGLAATCLQCRHSPTATPRQRLTDQRRMARNAVNDTVRQGRLAPVRSLPCFDCGAPAEEYDHHRGYERTHWLDVQAVCCRCHRRRDGVRRKAGP